MQERIITATGECVDGKFYGEHYVVTKDGRVYTLWRSLGKWREQKQREHSHGYMRVCIDGKDKYVHRIVAECFIENPMQLKEVNHKDGNKKNNNVDNLEWCTRSENNKHAFQTGLRDYNELKKIANCEKRREKAKERRRLTFEQAQEIRKMTDKTDREIAKIFNVARGSVYQIRHYKTYKMA